jgi:hypothetical protein
MIPNAPIYIGADPAFRAGGFWAAILDMADKSLVFRSFDLLTWHDFLRSQDAPGRCFIMVENSNLQNKSFDTTGSKLEVARKGRNVGCNQAVSELAYVSAVRQYGPKNVFQISPKDKGSKIKEHTMFLGLLKSEGILLQKGTTNQDQRDAAKLAILCRRKVLIEGRFTPKPAGETWQSAQ